MTSDASFLVVHGLGCLRSVFVLSLVPPLIKEEYVHMAHNILGLIIHIWNTDMQYAYGPQQLQSILISTFIKLKNKLS